MRRSRRAGTGSGSRSTLALVVADVFGTTLVTERCRAVLLASGVTRVVGSTIILAFRANKLFGNRVSDSCGWGDSAVNKAERV